MAFPKRRYDENIEAGSREMCFEEGKVMEFPQDVPVRGFGTSGIRWGIGIMLVLTSDWATVIGYIRYRPQLIAYPSRGKAGISFRPLLAAGIISFLVQGS